MSAKVGGIALAPIATLKLMGEQGKRRRPTLPGAVLGLLRRWYQTSYETQWQLKDPRGKLEDI